MMKNKHAMTLDHPYHDYREVPSEDSSYFMRVYNDQEIREYIEMADINTAAIGFTEHGFRHAMMVSQGAGYILEALGYAQEKVECARIAGLLHDIGNLFGRTGHGQTGATLAYPILTRLGLPAYEKAIIMGAIGNHEEEYGAPLNPVCAAVIVSDKADVHRSRVRDYDPKANDIHDDINYACVKSSLLVHHEIPKITLDLTIDTKIAPVIVYFETFLDRMVMSRRASLTLKSTFELIINDVVLS